MEVLTHTNETPAGLRRQVSTLDYDSFVCRSYVQCKMFHLPNWSISDYATSEGTNADQHGF